MNINFLVTCKADFVMVYWFLIISGNECILYRFISKLMLVMHSFWFIIRFYQLIKYQMKYPYLIPHSKCGCWVLRRFECNNKSVFSHYINWYMCIIYDSYLCSVWSPMNTPECANAMLIVCIFHWLAGMRTCIKFERMPSTKWTFITDLGGSSTPIQAPHVLVGQIARALEYP